MPPLDADELPTDDERAAAAAWIRASLKAYEADARRRSGTRDGPPADQRRVRLRASRPDRHRRQGRHRCVERLGRRRGLHELRRRAVRAGREHRAVSRSREAGRRSRGDRRRTAGVLRRSRQDRPRAVRAEPHQRALRRRRGSASSPAKADGRSASSATARRSSSPGTTSTASRSAIPPRRFAASRRRKASPAALPITSGSVVNKPNTGYPTRETVDGWNAAAGADRPTFTASLAQGARRAATRSQKSLTTWPSWFFARGDLAAGGAGDESPLVFDDETLKVEPAHRFTLRRRGSRRARARRGRPPPGSAEGASHLRPTSRPAPGVKPVVIWRNPRVVTRAASPPGAARPRRPRRPRELAARPGAAARFSRRSRCASMLPADAAAHAGVRHESGRHRDGPGRFRDAPDGVVRDRRAGRRQRRRVPGRGRARQGPERRGPRDDLRPAGRAPARRAASASSSAIRRAPATRRSARTWRSTCRCCRRTRTARRIRPTRIRCPPPFDNTYNSPEHDAFVLKVKYQRSDKFFTDNMVDGADRARLNQAWNDLFGSWPYHDAYLGMLADHYRLDAEEPPDRGPGRRADRGAAGRGPAVRDVAARALRRGDEGAGAGAAGSRRRRARRSPAAPGAGR